MIYLNENSLVDETKVCGLQEWFRSKKTGDLSRIKKEDFDFYATEVNVMGVCYDIAKPIEEIKKLIGWEA